MSNTAKKLLEDIITDLQVRQHKIVCRRNNLEEQITASVVEIAKIGETITGLQYGLNIIEKSEKS